VPGGVGHGLQRDPVRGHLHRGRQRRQRAVRRDVDVQPAAGSAAAQVGVLVQGRDQTDLAGLLVS
jgi:hypothetical protein